MSSDDKGSQGASYRAQGRWQPLTAACKSEVLRRASWCALLVYIFFLPLRHVMAPYGSTPRTVLLTLMCADLMCRALQQRWLRSALDYPLWGYAAAMALATGLSVSPGYSLQAFVTDLVPALVIYYASWQHLAGGRSPRTMAMVIVLSALVVVTAGFFMGEVEEGRLAGILPGSTRYGKYLDLVIPMTFALLLGARTWPTKMALGALSAAELGALFCTGTRGAWVALGTVFAATCLFARRAWTLGALALACLGALWLTPAEWAFRHRIADLVTAPSKLVSQDKALLVRQGYYRTVFAMIKERPIHGWGYGRHVVHKLDRAETERWFKEHGVQALPHHAHNALLQTLLEGGVIALFAALWVGFALAKAGLHVLVAPHTEDIAVRAGSMAGLAALAIHSLVEVPLWPTYILAMVYMAMVTPRGRPHLAHSSSPISRMYGPSEKLR